ncbi:rhamnan synthesis F family protein [Aggregatibacter actinomycetemcomitans]|uniref:rhamnan synthesis F family protein n=1 Tax=Aggregatibacter actinomycetemcomitans TaxID=714 RepID=UPI00197B3105|nr:rhamnan synthesis F family protein [Aggregatibacter actinomycetemcomitans]MBN6064012.1 hypothetical protein [Aggregatibacter actinomycetemcomitans]MBN6082272.1 hypothetical protein [Aggregatibacter actinomycetemcomitans]MBN6083913.1 hypothetical protein [Aggregatibacter actinomycetemcomitans]
MFKKIYHILKEKFFFNLMLSFLIKERYKMSKAAKSYSKMYPNGTIKPIKPFKGFDYVSLNNKNIILFVVYAPKSFLMYERYFQMLEKLNYKIITISNGTLDEHFVEKFKDKVVFMGERANIGRDFGTYKEFIRLLRQKNVTPNNLIICNDSVFANLKQKDNRFIDFLIKNENEDFAGVAEYMGKPGYHVQSYFLKFSHNVLKAPNFIKFWDSFLICDDRRLNIHNGEIKLSESILKDGFKPVVFLSTDNVINTILKNKETLQKFLIEVSANKHLDQHTIGGLKSLSLAFYNKKTTPEHIAYYTASLRQEISRMIDKFGMIVVCPFFIIDEFGFPFLKRDLVYRQITEWMLIREQGKLFDQDLLNEYINDQRIRRRYWNLASLKDKLMYNTGMN